MEVQLENTSRHPLTLVLTHEMVCSEARCICSRQRVVQFDQNPLTGDQSARAKSVRLPHSIQLFASGRPGSTSDHLPHVAVRAPDVVKAIRAGALKVIEIAEPVVEPPPPPPDGGSGSSESESTPPVDEPPIPIPSDEAPVAESAAVPVEADAQTTSRRTKKER